MDKKFISILLCLCMVLSAVVFTGAGDAQDRGNETEQKFEKKLLEATTEDGIAIQADGYMPEGARLEILALSPEALEYVRSQILNIGEGGEDSFFFAYDVKIVVGEGEEKVEFQPEELGVDVYFYFIEKDVCFGEDTQVYHLRDSLATLETLAGAAEEAPAETPAQEEAEAGDVEEAIETVEALETDNSVENVDTDAVLMTVGTEDAAEAVETLEAPAILMAAETPEKRFI